MRVTRANRVERPSGASLVLLLRKNLSQKFQQIPFDNLKSQLVQLEITSWTERPTTGQHVAPVQVNNLSTSRGSDCI